MIIAFDMLTIKELFGLRDDIQAELVKRLLVSKTEKDFEDMAKKVYQK